MQYKSSPYLMCVMAFVSCASLLACGGHRQEKLDKILGGRSDRGGRGTELGNLPQPPTEPTHQPPPIDTDFPAPILDGVWKANCVSSAKHPGDNAQNMQQEQARFDNGQALFVTDLSRKADCSAFTLSVLVYSTVQTQASHDGGKTYPADFVLAKIALIPRTQDDADDLSTVEAYGLTNWQKDVANDITGKKRFSEENALPERGRKLFDVFSLTNNELAFSLASSVYDPQQAPPAADGSTPAKRPSLVNHLVQFKKQ